MIRPHTRALFFPLWLAPLIGCDRAQESRKTEPVAEVIPEPVLKAGDDAETIIKKAVEAHGGVKSFSRWNCGYLKYKTKGGVIPAQLGECTVEDTFQLPGHLKRVTRVDAGGKEMLMVFVVNHGKGWTKTGDAPAEPDNSTFTERTEHPFAAFCNLTPLTEDGVNLTKLGLENVNGKEAIGVRAESDDLGEVDLYFGLQTGLLLRSRNSVRDVGTDKQGVRESFLDNYRNVEGTQVPMRIVGVQYGKTLMDVTLIDVRFADRFDESTFAKP